MTDSTVAARQWIAVRPRGALTATAAAAMVILTAAAALSFAPPANAATYYQTFYGPCSAGVADTWRTSATTSARIGGYITRCNYFVADVRLEGRTLVGGSTYQFASSNGSQLSWGHLEVTGQTSCRWTAGFAADGFEMTCRSTHNR